MSADGHSRATGRSPLTCSFRPPLNRLSSVIETARGVGLRRDRGGRLADPAGPGLLRIRPDRLEAEALTSERFSSPSPSSARPSLLSSPSPSSSTRSKPVHARGLNRIRFELRLSPSSPRNPSSLVSTWSADASLPPRVDWSRRSISSTRAARCVRVTVSYVGWNSFRGDPGGIVDERVEAAREPEVDDIGKDS